jgi:hypothetical protein
MTDEATELRDISEDVVHCQFPPDKHGGSRCSHEAVAIFRVQQPCSHRMNGTLICANLKQALVVLHGNPRFQRLVARQLGRCYACGRSVQDCWYWIDL